MLNEILKRLLDSHLQCQLECDRYAVVMAEYKVKILEIEKKIEEVNKLIESAGDKHEI